MASVIFTTSLVFLLLLVSLSKSMPTVHLLTLPESCIRKGFCFEKPDFYPQDLINEMNMVVNITDQREKSSSSATQNKTDTLPNCSSNNEEADCDTEKRMEPIYAIVDIDNNVRVVLQSDSLTQIVEVEECIKPGRILEPTVHFDQETVNMFNLRCQEQTIDVPFIALNMDWTGIEMVKSKHGIPIACSCVRLD